MPTEFLTSSEDPASSFPASSSAALPGWLWPLQSQSSSTAPWFRGPSARPPPSPGDAKNISSNFWSEMFLEIIFPETPQGVSSVQRLHKLLTVVYFFCIIIIIIIREKKYASIGSEYLFAPIAVETLSPMNTSVCLLFANLGKKISSTSGDDKEGAFQFCREFRCWCNATMLSC